MVRDLLPQETLQPDNSMIADHSLALEYTRWAFEYFIFYRIVEHLSDLIGTHTKEVLMSYAISDFSAKLFNASDSTETWRTIENYFTDIGFDVVNFGVLNRAHKDIAGVFSNMSADWMSYYVSEKYYESDPLIHRGVNDPTDFIFTQENASLLLSPEMKRGQQLFDEVAEIGIRSSVLLPYHDTHTAHLVMFNLGSADATPEFLKRLDITNDDVFVGAALAQSFLPKLLGDKEKLPAWYAVNSGVERLTAREIEVLNWVAAGLRNDRVADKMGITSATVNFHVTSIKKKLKAKTREHAVAIAFTHNLIG